MKKDYIKTFHEFNLNLYTISVILTCIEENLVVDEEIDNKINELIKFIDSKIDKNKIHGYDVYKEKYYVETFFEKPNFKNIYTYENNI